MRFNLYYISRTGKRGVIESIPMTLVLANVEACLNLGDEITGIIDAEKDN